MRCLHAGLVMLLVSSVAGAGDIDVYVQCDNYFELRVNGKSEMYGGKPGTKVIHKKLNLKPGDIIAAKCGDDSGSVGFTCVGLILKQAPPK